MLSINQLLLIKLLSSQVIVKDFLDVCLIVRSQFFYLFLEKSLTDTGLISGNLGDTSVLGQQFAFLYGYFASVESNKSGFNIWAIAWVYYLAVLVSVCEISIFPQIQLLEVALGKEITSELWRNKSATLTNFILAKNI